MWDASLWLVALRVPFLVLFAFGSDPAHAACMQVYFQPSGENTKKLPCGFHGEDAAAPLNAADRDCCCAMTAG